MSEFTIKRGRDGYWRLYLKGKPFRGVDGGTPLFRTKERAEESLKAYSEVWAEANRVADARGGQ